MTNEQYEKIFTRRNLPTDFDFWRQCAKGVARELRERNADAYYVDQADRQANDFNFLVGEDENVKPELCRYAERVLEMVDRIGAFLVEEERPQEVRDVYELLAKTIYGATLDAINKRFARVQDALDAAIDEVDYFENRVTYVSRTLEKLAERLYELKDELAK